MKIELIERLGGYGNAKCELELKEQNSVFQCCIAVDAEMIRDALLQYRREHNIFEVGDKVVYADAEFYKVVGIQGSRNIAVKDINSDFTMSIVSKHCRHATTEEIQAGGRLEGEKKQVQNRFNFLLDKNICNESEHAALKLKYMEITRLVQGLRNEFNLWSDDGEGSDAIEAQIELLEEALRGECE